MLLDVGISSFPGMAETGGNVALGRPSGQQAFRLHARPVERVANAVALHVPKEHGALALLEYDERDTVAAVDGIDRVTQARAVSGQTADFHTVSARAR